MACSFFDIDLEVYMVKVSYHQKPYRRIIMENFGAQVYPSPSDHTHTGQAALAADPNNPGSLGLATPALARRCKCLRSGGSGRHQRRRQEIQPWLGAGARAHAPDRSGPGSLTADGDGRRVPRLRHTCTCAQVQVSAARAGAAISPDSDRKS